MRVLIQRVKFAGVGVEGRTVGEIDKGLLLFLGVGREDLVDSEAKMDWLIRKIVNMRIFEDDNGKINLSVSDVGGSVLLVSQFTLYADCQRGNRPGFSEAAPPEEAEKIYLEFGKKLSEYLPVEYGKFGAMMEVELLNDGPCTIWLEK